MKNLFETAQQKTSKKVEKHEVVNLPQLESSLKRIAALNEKMAELEAERSILDSEIRESGKDAMINLYNKTQKFPGTLKIVAGSMQYQFITSDKYKKIDADGFEELGDLYGEEIVEKTTTFSFNTEVLMKHMEHISQLLMSSKELSDQEKENLLVAETTYTVKKGVIKSLFDFVKGSVNEIVESIQPVFSVKSIQKIS